jgi:hypothetical protein
VDGGVHGRGWMGVGISSICEELDLVMKQHCSRQCLYRELVNLHTHIERISQWSFMQTWRDIPLSNYSLCIISFLLTVFY